MGAQWERVDMEEKWQKALAKLDAWNKSINDCRAIVDAKYGDLSKLLNKGTLTEIRIKKQSSKHQLLSITGNEEAKILWNLYDEVSEIASRFVTEQIGIPRTAFLYGRFRRHWLNSAFPEIIESMPSELLEEMPIWFKPMVKKERDGNRVVCSVSWYPNQVSQNDVAQFVLSLEPITNEKHILKKAKGGRHTLSRRRLQPEAIVCAILRDQQRLTYKQIAALFGWKLQADEHGTLRISNTVASRVKEGRKILKQHNNI